MGLLTLWAQPSVAGDLPDSVTTDNELLTGQYETTAEGLMPEARFSGLDYNDLEVIFPSDEVARGAPDPDFDRDSPLSNSSFEPSLNLQLGATRAVTAPGHSNIEVLLQDKPKIELPKTPAATKPGPVLLTQVNTQNETLPNSDPELGIIRVSNESGDPELGILRIREQPLVPETPPQEPPRIGTFTARFSAASSDNILLAVDDVGGLTGDEFLRPGVSLAFYPPVGPRTFLIGNIDVYLQRYTTRSDINYDDLRFRLGVRQGLFPRTYGQLMFTYQQLFRPGQPRFRFFENTALSFTLGRRDPLTSRLTLNSYYQVQLNDAEVRSSPDSPTNYNDFDRITQFLGGSLSYTISPQFQTGVSYQVTFADYTGQERYDTYHQLIGQLTYRITPDVRMSLYGGWSFGRSSEPRIKFNDTLFGITVDATVTLF